MASTSSGLVSGPHASIPRPAGRGEITVDSGGHMNAEPAYIPYNPTRYMDQIAQEIQERSIQEWGPGRAAIVVGLSSQLSNVLEQVKRVAQFDEPVLITGESGSGKEALAQAIYLLGSRRGMPMVTLNCPQYHEGNLTASEFFGHKRGSFTGAVADRKGSFEAADGGVIFLDEVGDLPMSTQVMLLRTLATGAICPVGSSEQKAVKVRVIAATNRNLRTRQTDHQFREDLYFRLSFFRIEVPPLRERQDDWALLAEYFLRRLCDRYGVAKKLSTATARLLSRHNWPGNVRELASMVTMGYAMADGPHIEPEHFASQMEAPDRLEESLGEKLCREMSENRRDFWTTVHAAFMRRDLNRSQVKSIVRQGLVRSQGSFRELVERFRLPSEDYQKFMDFLRHHDLKP